MSLCSYFQSVRFLLTMNFRKPGKHIKLQEVTLTDSQGQNLIADVYYPKTKKKKSLIIFYHGMNKFGRKDPRVQDVCDVLRNMGYTVLAPDMPLVRKLHIKSDAVAQIIQTTQIIKDSDFTKPYETIGLFAASYTVAGVVYSVTQPGMQKFANVICAIGGCLEPNNSFKQLLSSKITDHYATATTIWNLGPEQELADAKIETAMRIMIDDALEENNFKQTHEYLTSENLTPHQRERIEYWLKEIKNPSDLYRDAGFQLRCEEASREVLKLFHQENLSVPCMLIHNPEDEVMDVSESINFKKMLDQRKIKNYLILTGLLDHADVQFKVSYFMDLFHLVKAFAFFFSRL